MMLAEGFKHCFQTFLYKVGVHILIYVCARVHAAYPLNYLPEGDSSDQLPPHSLPALGS
jgi:hypothetical protein